MNFITLFLPINPISLAHYYSKGCILPANHYRNKESDIQNLFEDVLLFSKLKWTESATCTLEVIITEDEQHLYLAPLTRHFLSFSALLPISRIKAIYFSDAEVRDNTLWNINAGTAFVDYTQTFIEIRHDNDIAKESELFKVSPPKRMERTENLLKKIKYYDHLLGGFSFMRLGGEDYANFSPNYFSTVSLFNKTIENQLKIVSKTKLDKKFHGLISQKEEDPFQINNLIYNSVETDNVISFAKEHGQTIKTNYLKKLELAEIDPKSSVYLLAILSTYGSGAGKSKKTEDLIADIYSSKINIEVKEVLTLIYGINIGYSKLNNQYRINDEKRDVKFRLDTKLDYYIIESVFQFCFNGKRDNYEFEYIDSNFKFDKKESINLKEYSTYNILGSSVIIKKKQQVGSKEYFEELFKTVSVENIYKDFLTSVKGWFPSFVHLDESLLMRIIKNDVESTLKQEWIVLLDQYRQDLNQEIELGKDQKIIEMNGEIESLRSNIRLLEKGGKPKDNYVVVPSVCNEDHITQANINDVSSSEGLLGNENQIYAETNTVNMTVVNDSDNIPPSEISNKPIMESSVSYNDLSHAELLKIAKAKHISGVSKMKSKDREKLIKILNAKDNEPTIDV